MAVKQEVLDNFQALISKTNKESFIQAKLKLYETIFTNYSDEDSLYVVLTAFEMSCEAYLITDFLPLYNKALRYDFQNILIALDAFQSEE
ncbi:hypothetical protein SL053_002050 [Flavobacterium psychrophilum]|nr:hypothetical protein [Flavobacterium psychrophilum]